MKNETANAKPIPKTQFYILMGIIGVGLIAVVLRMSGLI